MSAGAGNCFTAGTLPYAEIQRATSIAHEIAIDLHTEAIAEPITNPEIACIRGPELVFTGDFQTSARE